MRYFYMASLFASTNLINRRRYAERSERNSNIVARGMKRPHGLVAYDNKDDNYLQRHNELSGVGLKIPVVIRIEYTPKCSEASEV